MKNRVLAVSDCDHYGMEEELTVCRENDLEMIQFQCHTEEDLIRDLKGFPVVLNQYAPFTEHVFANLPDLKAIVRYGVGVNNIDLTAASRHQVAVCNVPDYGIGEVAGHAFALMMALNRKIVRMDASVKSGEWEYARSIPIRRGKTLTVGIIGLGRIGSCFAELVRPFCNEIIGYDINTQKKGPDFVRRTDFHTLLKEADVISIHSNLETSKHLIDAAALDGMKKEAVLINVSRGGIIDETALCDALNQEKIGGAGIDVTEIEPLPADSPLLTAKNLILTPHMAWYSEESSSDLKRKTAEEGARFLTGQPLKNQVNHF